MLRDAVDGDGEVIDQQVQDRQAGDGGQGFNQYVIILSKRWDENIHDQL